MPEGRTAPPWKDAPHNILEAVKVAGFMETILGPLEGNPIIFPFGAKKTDWSDPVPVKIFVKFPPSVVDVDTVARQAVLYIAEFEPDAPAKNTFPFGRRTAPENCEEPANVGPIFVYVMVTGFIRPIFPEATGHMMTFPVGLSTPP